MNKKNITIISILLLLIVVGLVFIFFINNDKVDNLDKTDNQEEEFVLVEKNDSPDYFQYDLEFDEFDSITDISENTIKEFSDKQNVDSDKDKSTEKVNVDDSNNVDETKVYENVDSFVVDLILDVNPGFAILDVRCYYDANILEIIDLEAGEVNKSLDMSPVIQKDKKGTFIILDFDYSGTMSNSTGDLAHIYFKVLDGQVLKDSSVSFVFQEACDNTPKLIDGFKFSSKISNIKFK